MKKSDNLSCGRILNEGEFRGAIIYCYYKEINKKKILTLLSREQRAKEENQKFYFGRKELIR